MKNYYVYIVGSESGVIYIGVTNNLERRIFEHKNKLVEGFTNKYNCNKLLFFENTTDVECAISREKQLKRWSRKKKIELIKKTNSNLEDLSTTLEMTANIR